MMIKNKIHRTVLILMLAMIALPTAIKAQGLRFYGKKEPIIEHRTSYTVFTDDKMVEFSKYLDVEFELNILDFNIFGYLFHFVDPKTKSEYSLTYTYTDSKSSDFKFNSEGEANLISINILNDSIKTKWIPVKLHIDLTSGKCSLSIDGNTVESNSNIAISSNVKPRLTFGRREHLSDVPSFAIRKLNLTDSRRTYNFPLDESHGEDVHDSTGEITGKVLFQYWLINDSYHWSQILKLSTLEGGVGSNFSEIRQCIYFVNQDSLFTYDLENKQVLRQAYANTMPVKMLLGTNYINQINDKLYAYEINNLPLGSTTIAELNIATLSWMPIGKAHTDTQLHHHNGFLDSKREHYIVFGGFGSKKYSNKFLNYNSQADIWDELKFSGDIITPRFMSSIASADSGDYFYIYGGIGNELGDQSIGHNYYNDLYRIDVRNHSIRKCWENSSDETKVPAGKMILSKDEKHLYIIRYAEYKESTFLQLYRVSVETGEMEAVGDSIPFVSRSIASNIALYHNSILNEFYCVINQFNEDANTADAMIYRLCDPPVNLSKVELYSSQEQQNHIYWVITLLLLGCVGGIYYVFSYRKRVGRRDVAHTESIPSKIREKEAGVQKNRIYVYGLFTIYDRTGLDITYLFSNKLKHIFLYIFFNSDKNGVSSTSLNEVFWADKPEEKARNLKGVTISNLRKALSEIDGIELVYGNGFFKIIISEPCYCDYIDLHKRLAEDANNYDQLMTIWERGKLLENSNSELFDKFKQYSEDIIFSSLPQLLPQLYKQKDSEGVLRICAILLKRDPLYELALIYSIHVYNERKESENAYKAYSSFIINYRSMMGESYSKTLKSLLQQTL